MKAISGVVALLLVALVLFPHVVLAQTHQDAIRLQNEALELQQKAKSNEDLKKALQKYEAALTIHVKVGDWKNAEAVHNNVGRIYADWGQYPKAVEHYEKSLELARKTGNVQGVAQTLGNLGKVFERLGQYPKAVEYYEKYLELARKTRYVHGEADALDKLGELFMVWGQHTKAVGYYEKSLDLALKARDVRSLTIALNGLGLVFMHLGQYPSAVKSYERSLEVARKTGSVQGEASTLNNLGNVFMRWGQYPRAVEYFERSLELGRKTGDVGLVVIALNNLGTVFVSWGQYPKALECYEKSLELKRKTGDLRGEALILNHVAGWFKVRGQYPKAVEYYERSLDIARKVGDPQIEANALGLLAVVYKDWGQYYKAMEYGEKSLEIARKVTNLNTEAGVLNDLGNAYKDWGQYSKAEEYLKKSLEIRQEIGDLKGQGATLSNLGQVYEHSGDRDKALRNYEQCLEIFSRIGNPATWPKERMGNLYLDAGDIPRAEGLLREADHERSLGRLSLVKGEYDKAKTFYEKLLKVAEESRDAAGLFMVYTGLGLACEGLRDYRAAEDYFRKAVSFLEEQRSSFSHAERETYFDVRVGGFYRMAPYEGLARVLVLMNRPVEALRESEYTRARIFAESVSKRSENAGLDVPKKIRDVDAQLSVEVAEASKSLQQAYEKGNQEQISVMEPHVKEAKRKLAVHVDMLRKQYPLFAATRYPEPMSLKDSAVKADEWILEYEVTDTGLCTYLVHGKQVVKAVFKPISRKDLDDKVRRFMEPFEGVNAANYTAKLNSVDLSGAENSLSRLLLGDILPELPKGAPVVVIPDDCLGVIPFEMLALNSEGKVTKGKSFPVVTGAEFFDDRNPISYYQSITALTLARILRSGRGEGKKLLVMADPVFELADIRVQKGMLKTETLSKIAKELNEGATKKMVTMITVEESHGRGVRPPKRLEKTSKLAEELHAIYGGHSDVFTGMEASKEAFLKKLGPHLDQYKEIVFATHGYFGKDLPGITEPVLMLTTVPPGTDGFLKLSEVMGLRMNADSVALTACMSGLGKRISGEGVMGMGRAFQYAGAKCVLMSLWSVQEAASVKLMEKFFRSLHKGKPKLEALRSARDEIRKEGYDHPFFWAPFIIVGEVN
ncbi:MAG: tetratricopeptide repeat protein [Thermodesulfobacteriota bacterium]